MKTITSKIEIREIAADLDKIYQKQGLEAMIGTLHTDVLQQKVKFPVWEELAIRLYKTLPVNAQLAFCDAVMGLAEMGSSVIAGKMLQLRLPEHFLESLNKAVQYIVADEEWYVCDHIGERVQGVALLTEPVKAIKYLSALSDHENPMAVRSVGVATHYAVKKGLDKNHAEQMFQLLLQKANATQHHVKTGIGWGTKTVVKFYPAIAVSYKEDLEKETTGQWFRSKVKTGLSRSSKYARND